MKSFSTSLRTRIILTYLAIFLVSTAIMTGLAGWFYAQSALRNAYQNLEAQAFVAASALERTLVFIEGAERARNLPDLEILAQRFTQNATSQISVVDFNGNVILTSLSAIPTNQAASAEIQMALAGRIGHAVRWDPVSRQTMIYAAAPVRRLGRPLFAVQISMPFAEVTRETRRFWLGLGFIAFLAALAAALAGWWLAATVVRPVGRLQQAAARLAAGALDARVSERETGGIVEIAQLAVAFNHMAARVQEMMNRQRAFVANASHELRTPITNIKLRAEALSTGALDDRPVAERFAREIEGEADRLGRLASDLLTLSRQDVGAHRPIAPEQLDLGALATQVVEEMMLRGQKAGVTLRVVTEPGLPLAWADPEGLYSVLTNLLDNALQHTPSGGQITVSLAHEAPHLVLRVSDTGVGIPAEDLPHIFERFYRVDKARSRQRAVVSSGAGLGLAIVEGIVREHGGTVAAESTLGQGTTITVRLPTAPPR